MEKKKNKKKCISKPDDLSKIRFFLPLELLKEVILFLNTDERMLLEPCKELQDISKDIPIDLSEFWLSFPQLKEIMNKYRYSCVYALYLKYLYLDNFNLLTEVFGKNLRCLKLDRHMNEKSFSDLTFLRGLPHLEILFLDSNKINFRMLDIHTKLSFLSISKCKISENFTDLKFHSLLTFLELDNCENIISIEELFDIYINSNIKNLWLKDCRWSNSFHQKVEENVEIKRQTTNNGGSICIRNSLDDIDLSSLSLALRFKNPSCLIIMDENKLTDITDLNNCTDLLQLDLIGCSALIDISIISTLQKLTHLTLKRCTLLTDISSVSFCENLIDLDISESNINDLSSLNRCIKLRILTINSSDIKTLKDLVYCPSLETFSLFNNINLIDIDNLKYLTKIKYLRLDKCIYLKNISCLESLTLLEHISIAGCCSIENISSISKCTRLISINLDKCKSVNSILPFLKCTCLKYVGLPPLLDSGNMEKNKIANEFLYLKKFLNLENISFNEDICGNIMIPKPLSELMSKTLISYTSSYNLLDSSISSNSSISSQLNEAIMNHIESNNFSDFVRQISSGGDTNQTISLEIFEENDQKYKEAEERAEINN